MFQTIMAIWPDEMLLNDKNEPIIMMGVDPVALYTSNGQVMMARSLTVVKVSHKAQINKNTQLKHKINIRISENG